MKPHCPRLLLSALAFTLAAGCSSRTVKPQQSYEKLKPIGVAPQTSSTPTLVVQINNVCDQDQSRKNSAALFINDQEIAPSHAKGSNPRDYIYELSLTGGTYKIQAVYRAQSFWKAKEFKINTQDGKVRIYPGHSTRLAITLEKKPDGTLQRQKNFFSEIPQSLSPKAVPVADQRSVSPFVATPQPQQQLRAGQPNPPPSFIEITSPASQSIQAAPTAGTRAPSPLPLEPEPEPAARARRGQIALQINTLPSNAEIIVDDKYLGQSPLVTYVDRRQNHVIQISKEGYAARIKLLDYREFGEQEVYNFIEKLEAQK